MKENPRVYSAFVSDARTRGPSPIEHDFDEAAGAERTHPRQPAPHHAISAALSAHQIWARNWVYLTRPLYIVPFELMQQYFSFIFACPRWISSPVTQQTMGSREPLYMRHAQTDKPGTVDGDGQCEEAQQAMDVAIGATTEMWVELIHEGTSPEQEQQREQEQKKPRQKEVALLVAA